MGLFFFFTCSATMLSVVAEYLHNESFMRSKAEYFPVVLQGRMAGFLYIMEKKCTYFRKLNDSNIKHNDNNLNCVLRISNYIDVVGK